MNKTFLEIENDYGVFGVEVKGATLKEGADPIEFARSVLGRSVATAKVLTEEEYLSDYVENAEDEDG